MLVRPSSSVSIPILVDFFCWRCCSIPDGHSYPASYAGAHHQTTHQAAYAAAYHQTTHEAANPAPNAQPDDEEANAEAHATPHNSTVR